MLLFFLFFFSVDTDPNETMMDDCGKVPYEKDSKIIASNGDIYTKVAMPRSKSFMKINHNHNGNQYNLQDLFKELKDQVCTKIIFTFSVKSISRKKKLMFIFSVKNIAIHPVFLIAWNCKHR